MSEDVIREPVGRRARKKERQRQTILREALQLFLSQGFKETTVAQIADAADIAASTFFLYFPSKDDLLFAGHSQSAQTIVAALANRESSVTTVSILRAIAREGTDSGRWGLELWDLRARVIKSDPALSGQERARWAEVVRPALIQSYAADINEQPPAIRARLLTAMTIGPMLEVGRIDFEVEALSTQDEHLSAHRFLAELFDLLESTCARFAEGNERI
jgi:AcrR family transcriptional regulator